MTPLNLYIRTATRDQAGQALLDYGQAIRDLAVANIFPGDLLLKNFGVTRHNRVIFYDYDELCLVTDCPFREIPSSEHGWRGIQHRLRDGELLEVLPPPRPGLQSRASE